MLITSGSLTKPFWGRELHIIIQLNSGGSIFSLKSFRSLHCNNCQNWWDMDLQWLSDQQNGCDAGWDFQNSFSYRVNCNHLNHHRFRGNSNLSEAYTVTIAKIDEIWTYNGWAINKTDAMLAEISKIPSRIGSTAITLTTIASAVTQDWWTLFI